MAEPGPSTDYYRRFAQTANGPVRPPSPSEEPMFGRNETPQEFLDTHATDSLYALLNVERAASTNEIKDQYRALASIYHPDKQPDEEHRRAAHARFTAIQRAYEVLTDDAQRTIYDMFGEEGLRTKWDVGPRNQSKAALRARFLKEDEVRRRLDAAALIDSQSDMSITLDARGVFLPKSAFEDPTVVEHTPLARIQRLQTGQVLMKHSIETPISDSTQFVVEGTMAARKGAGGANISGTIKHQFSPRLWMQFTQTALHPRISSVKGTYTFDEFTYLTGTALSQMWSAPPRLSLTLGRRLYPETTGFITFNSGFWSLGPWGRDLPDEVFSAAMSSLSIGATTARMNGSGWTVECQTGLVDNHVSLDWSTYIAGLRLKFGGGVDMLGGANLFARASGMITEHTRGGAQLNMYLGGQITFQLFVNRLGQKLTLPILLSFDNNPYVVFFSTVLPTAAYAAAYHWFILPRKLDKIANRVKELQKEHADYTAQKREEAAEAAMAMERVVGTRVAAERRRNGLVILDAKYGRADAFTSRGYREVTAEDGFPAIIDVTTPLQMLVQDSRLYIPAGRAKHGLNGFYDPCIGENKKLRVRYLFRGIVHEVTVDDVSSLRAPVQAHAVDE